MEFRPCIDIHNGKVKQIVGGSLKDSGDQAQENFVSEQDAAFYAALYQKNKLKGGHIILLNSYDSPYYEETRKQALAALQAYPGGLQVGGGITPENAGDYLNAGASHVIVTSYVFREGRIDYDRLERLVYAVGRERLVLDVSCKRVGEKYLVEYARRLLLQKNDLHWFRSCPTSLPAARESVPHLPQRSAHLSHHGKGSAKCRS